MIKRISAKEFRDIGYLQEVNRQFLHPLGLALEVIIDEDTGDITLGGVWDLRDIKGGMIFESIDVSKAMRVIELQGKLKLERLEDLGYYIQPIEIKDA